jgi:hypothetical protein
VRWEQRRRGNGGGPGLGRAADEGPYQGERPDGGGRPCGGCFEAWHTTMIKTYSE